MKKKKMNQQEKNKKKTKIQKMTKILLEKIQTKINKV